MTPPATERELVNALWSLMRPAKALLSAVPKGIATTVQAARAAAHGARHVLVSPPTDADALLAYDVLERLADSVEVAASAFAHYGGAPLTDEEEHGRGALDAALYAAQEHVARKRHLLNP
jgi:hypothetical protein